MKITSIITFSHDPEMAALAFPFIANLNARPFFEEEFSEN
jgi:hypothetical protein